MLRGEKPLAVFYDWEGSLVPSVARYIRMFDRRVSNGVFVRRDHLVPADMEAGLPGAWYVFFARADEAWRIDAMIELKKGLYSGGWTLEHERREGMLLGYEDWQNEIWLARIRQSQIDQEAKGVEWSSPL